jgi:hypothetical protein
VKNNLRLLLLFLILSVFTVSAQENSPYTRFGVGELSQNPSADLQGWGNLTAAYQDPLSFNITNPASLASIGTHIPIFQAAVYGNVMQVKSAGNSPDYFGHSGPEYLTFAMSLKKGWGISFGLMPYSSVNYNIYQLNGATNGIPSSANQFTGSGDLYEAYLGTGWAIKSFSFGISGAYMFGTLVNNSEEIFSDSLNGFNTNYQSDRKVSGFTWNAGIQYEQVFGKRDKKTHKRVGNNHLVLGLSGHTSISVNARRDYIYNRFYYDPTLGTPTPYDTIAASFNQKGTIVIPKIINGGLMWKYKQKWSIGVNYTYNYYKSYSSFGSPDSTANSYTASIGAEYLPNATAEEGYFNKVKYRVGFYTSDYYLSFNNNQIKNAGITVGAGLPINFTYVDIALNFGKLGTTQNNLVEQSYINMTIGLRFVDGWFKKRVYN